MRRLFVAAAGLLCASLATAAPITNGTFSTGDLSGWTVTESPTTGLYTPPAPGVYTSHATGIGGPGGSSDYYAALDTTLANGNPVGTDIWTAIGQSATIGTATSTLQFTLLDYGDTAPPTIDNNHSAMLLDNISVTENAGVYTLGFNWYALTKTDQQRNDLFTVSYNDATLWSFDYSSSALPIRDGGGGGGNQYGAFSYGTGWNYATVTVPQPPPVPEPGTWMVLAGCLVPVLKRRRGR